MYKETKCSLCYTELSVWTKAEFCEALFLPNVYIITCNDSYSWKVTVTIFFTA